MARPPCRGCGADMKSVPRGEKYCNFCAMKRDVQRVQNGVMPDDIHHFAKGKSRKRVGGVRRENW